MVMQMESELNPCPSGVGCKRIEPWWNGSREGDGQKYRVVCYDCGWEGPECATEEAAIAAWNTRPALAGGAERTLVRRSEGFDGPSDGEATWVVRASDYDAVCAELAACRAK